MREPAFQEPWHAQVFALTLHLVQQGLFSWNDWTKAIGATLKRNGLAKSLDGGDDYFLAWLETLERILIRENPAHDQEITALVRAWRDA